MLRDVGQESLIREILTGSRTWALYGMSANPIRPSHFVGTYLSAHDFDFVSVNPGTEAIFRRPCFPTLAAIPRAPEVVVIFRRAEECPAVVKEAIAAKARYVWLQLGLVSPESRELAAAAGIGYVEDRCVKVEHCRYHGNLFQAGINTGLISARRRGTNPVDVQGISVAAACEIPPRKA